MFQLSAQDLYGQHNFLAFLNTCNSACFEADKKKNSKDWDSEIMPWEADLKDTRYGPIGRTKGLKKNNSIKDNFC